jgi:hypothetical protein
MKITIDLTSEAARRVFDFYIDNYFEHLEKAEESMHPFQRKYHLAKAEAEAKKARELDDAYWTLIKKENPTFYKQVKSKLAA